ncbi:uncharacterized protein LOC133908039 [Phragmites australis]|uniref:uncharacterized protein LOC133908039 n=1 Tax=Phragmites australis TaxID=29695 RepID=UPI002D796021|nr:uncharacterized protein LOC133908039 [Phragmites australis]
MGQDKGRGRGRVINSQPSEEVHQSRPSSQGTPLPPPSENDLVAVMANQTRLLEALAQTGINNQGYGPQNKMAEFMRIKPPTFDSTDDPLEADDWLRAITKNLKVINCEGQERVNLAAHQLTGSAAELWENYYEASVDADTITWEEFCGEFRKYHVPKGTMEMKSDEFRNLKQGSMTVNQYIRKFIRLSRYAPKDVSTHKKKQDRFKKGLICSLYVQLVHVIYPNFNTMMNKTLLLEEARAPIEAERKRRFFDQKHQGNMFQWAGPNQRQKVQYR